VRKSTESAAEGRLVLHPAMNGGGPGPRASGEGGLLGAAFRHLLEDAEPAAVTDAGGKLLYTNEGFQAALPALLAAAADDAASDAAGDLGGDSGGHSAGAAPRDGAGDRSRDPGGGLDFLPPLLARLTPRPGAWSAELASDLRLPREAGRGALRLHLGGLADEGGRLQLVVLRLLPDEDPALLRRELAALRERLDDIVRLVSDWIWESDRDLHLTFLSGGVVETLGLHPRHLLGRPLTELFVGPAETLERLRGEEGRKPFRDLALVARDGEGQERHLRLSGVPCFDPDQGSFLGFRGTVRDVTERLRHEADLRRSGELAESASRAKSRFLASVSHELRTPLNAIIGFSQIMAEERFGPLGSEAYRGYAGDVLRSAEHLLGLINAVLDVSRIEAGKRTLSEEAVALDELFVDARRLLQGQAAETGVSLRIVPLPEDTLVWAERRALLQILVNLLGNALKFTPPGGAVELSGRAGDEGLMLEVRDEGIGMSAEEIQIALTPFGQVDSGLARRYQGSGLGLPLAQGLVELHGGRLEIESAPGAGTCVRMLLPGARLTRARQPQG